MKNRRLKYQPNALQADPLLVALLVQSCDVVDRGMPSLRTWCLIVGMAAAAMHGGRAAWFLVATGLIFQCAIWFEGWWGSRPSNR